MHSAADAPNCSNVYICNDLQTTTAYYIQYEHYSIYTPLRANDSALCQQEVGAKQRNRWQIQNQLLSLRVPPLDCSLARYFQPDKFRERKSLHETARACEIESARGRKRARDRGREEEGTGVCVWGG